MASEMVWVYYEGAIDQVLSEHNPDLNMLAGMYPDAIYFYAELMMSDSTPPPG